MARKAKYSVVDDELIDWIIKEEGFLDKPTDIGDGKVTIGSGLTDPKWIDKYKKKGYWSKEDNRKAVAEELQKRSEWAEDTLPNWGSLPANTKKAMLSYKYNYDFTKENSPKLFGAMESGNFIEAVRQMDATSKNPKFKKGLQARREREQQWGLQGLFEKPVLDRSYEYSDATTLVNPYTAKIQNITFTDQYVPTSPAYNLVEADKVSAEINEYDKVKRAIDAQAAYRRLIQDNAWENQELKRYVPTSGINYVIDSYSEGGKLDRKKSWDELSIKEKADMIRVAVDNDITTLPEIREKYNEFAMGGGTEETYDEPQTFKRGIKKFIKDKAIKVSKTLMDYIQETGTTERLVNPFTFSGFQDMGPGQETFLLPRKLQKEVFINRGYIEGKEGDYGLVKRAVGKHKYPIYQRNPDAISRDKLIVLGNTNTSFLDYEHGLEHENSAPSAVYSDFDGNLYQKFWDLNDYGGKGGSTSGVFGDVLDFIGNPVVVTTGFQPFAFTDKHPYYVKTLAPMMAKKGLVPTIINGKTQWTLPEITVTPQKIYLDTPQNALEKYYKDYKNVNIYDGLTEDSQQMEREVTFGNTWLPEITVYPGNIRAAKLNAKNRLHDIPTHYIANTTNEYPIVAYTSQFPNDRPLEIVSPEFDMLALSRGLLSSIGKRAVVKSSIKVPDKAKYVSPKVSNYEADWTPEKWLTKRAGNSYDVEDVEALTSHVPEYRRIERISKENGTWLKMPDGSTWKGDPRSWIQLQSEAAQVHNPDVFWTGIDKEVDPNYTGQIWGTFGPGKTPAVQARAYAPSDSKTLPMFTTKNAKVTDFNAAGSEWGNINKSAIGANGFKEDITTNMLVDASHLSGDDITKIHNVIDPGPNIIPYDSDYFIPGITNNFRLPQNNIILRDGFFRKALVGNNGNFSHSTNIYKGIAPLVAVEETYRK